MKARTTTVRPDSIGIEGFAWGRDLPRIVICEYRNGEVVKRVRVPVRPVDIQELARCLWDLRGKYEQAVADMTAALQSS